MPSFRVDISTSSFKYKQSPIKERCQSKYIPEYWRKLSLDQKTISPCCEDRLSELTTKQIDRIIDMEKIKNILNDNKNKREQI